MNILEAILALHLCWANLPAVLEKRYSEHPVLKGEINRETKLVMYSSQGGRTWTLVVEEASGKKCMILAGSSLSVPAQE